MDEKIILKKECNKKQNNAFVTGMIMGMLAILLI